ncbi:MAG: PAS domain S-box protein [Phormidium sp. GEM2.Bin31]|nr:MAG: PAS domain S-box protein [Phormidium sp. GEM2.Bin31]
MTEGIGPSPRDSSGFHDSGSLTPSRKTFIGRHEGVEHSNDFNLTLLRQVLDQSGTAIALFNRDLKAILWTQPWQDLFDVHPDAGQPYSELVPHAPPSWLAAYRRCLDGLPSVCPPYLLKLENGDRRWLKEKLSPWYNEQGNVSGVIVETQRLDCAEALAQSWPTVFDNSPDLHCLIDQQGILQQVNPAWHNHLGYDPKDLCYRQSLDYVHPEEINSTQTAFHDLTPNAHICFKNRYRHQDGSYRWCQWTLVVLGDGQYFYGIGRVLASTSSSPVNPDANNPEVEQLSQTLSDTLDELRQTQRQLVQTEKMSSLGQLVAGIAHEINNPVNFIYGNLVHAKEYTEDILGLLDLYQQHYSEPASEISEEADSIDLEFLLDDLPQLLSSMMVGANRVKEIVSSLRNFSRLDEVEMKRSDLHEGLDSTLVILQNRIKAKPSRPEIVIDKHYDDLPKVECFTGQMNQVFMNIVSNAIDALEDRDNHRSYQEVEAEPSRLTLTTIRNADDTVTIRIADNASGVPESVRQQIFKPFFTTKPVGKGTGLGLSISYQIIVEKHRGTLECRSTLGEGTEFLITIPISHSDSD